jgi:cytochrome c peroxidase
MRAVKALVSLCVVFVGLPWIAGLIDSPTEASTGIEVPATARPYDFRAESLAETYDRWKGSTHRDPGRYEIAVPLAWFPGVSAERSQAKGLAVIDMNAGTVVVDLAGIDLESLAEVWLIDNRPGAGASTMPDATDAMHLVGNLQVEAGNGTLRADVNPKMFRGFDIDRVVVARRGEGPVRGGVLYGSLPLFERLHRVSWRLEQGLAPIAGDESSQGGLLSEFPRTAVAAASSEGALRPLGVLVDEGEDLFDNETFDGNGRTCATCHPAENNFTIDKEFIAGLPADDPLFVAEFIPELNHELNGGLFFENPVLMREFGLIVENVDGFDDLANKYVLRSVNHLFALALSIDPSMTNNCEEIPPFHRLGWGGDGGHGSGTLREFATGAVIQHNPLTLGRVEGEDFRLPTDEELDALEAFQLSLGRTETMDLRQAQFTDPNVDRGRTVFIQPNLGRCHGCHHLGSALRLDPGTSNLTNHNFDIGVGQVPHPAQDLGEPMPFDDGHSPHPDVPRCRVTFNTPSLFEAADTPPFEHNNVFETLEDAIGHYGTPEFNEGSIAGITISQTPTGPIELSEEEIGQIGAMLRVVNALQNIDDVLKCDTRVVATTDQAEARRLLKLCAADNEDAIQVLSEGPLAPLHPIAVDHLNASRVLHKDASRASTPAERDAALAAAEVELAAARANMIDETP